MALPQVYLLFTASLTRAETLFTVFMDLWLCSVAIVKLASFDFVSQDGGHDS
jgi:hypothetical protein